MKKIIFAAALIFSCMLIKTADAQVQFSLGINIGSQPDWGPVGYDRVNYYYLPDIDAYYDVPAHQYVYYQNNVWIHSVNLPVRYRNYDVYNGYKVVVNERNPWERNNVYRVRYAKFKGRKGQPIIRNSRDEKYREHWNNGRGNDRGRGNDWNNNGRGNEGRDNGRGNEGRGNNGRGNGNGRGHGKG